MEISNEVVAEGLFNMGIISKQILKTPGGHRQLQLIGRAVLENSTDFDVYYNMYLRNGDKSSLQGYTGIRFVLYSRKAPKCASYGPIRIFDTRRRMSNVQDSIYEAPMPLISENDNRTVHGTRLMKEKYPLSPLMPTSFPRCTGLHR